MVGLDGALKVSSSFILSPLNCSCLTNPQPNLLRLKKAQAIWRGVLNAEVSQFPKENHNGAFTRLKAATRLEKSSLEDCIALQRRAPALMALELEQARYAAYAAEKALEEVTVAESEPTL